MVTPKGIDIAKMTKAIDAGLIAGVNTAKALFHESYANWRPENQPEFQTLGPVTRGGNRQVTYQTTSETYTRVSNGTEGPYPITPKRPGGFLRFKAGSAPKTMPGKLQSSAGAPGKEWVTTKEVQHPGIAARNFPAEVVSALEPTVVAATQDEISNSTGG